MQEKSWEINLNRTNNQIEHIEGPYGYGVNIIENPDIKQKRKDTSIMKVNKAKDLAFGQLKTVFTTMLSFYFIGGSLSLITIFIVGLYFYNSLTSITSVNTTFKMFENPEYSIVQYKIIFVAIQSVVVAAILYRIYGMGLLPLNPGDWVSMIETNIPELDILN